MSEIKQVICRLNQEKYGIEIMRVNAIEKYQNIVRIPNAPNFILGIINLRGEVIPVYSLRKKFGLSEATITEDTKLIITCSRGMVVAFQVDSVDEILEIQNEDIRKPPKILETDETKYIGNIANMNKEMILLLDVDNILSEQEQSNINDMVEEMVKE